MNRFTKRPLKTKTSTMKTKTTIIAIIITLIIVSAAMYHNYTVNALEEAKNTLIEQINTPTELESAVIELDMNRIERTELQRQIDKLVGNKKEKAKRADELNENIRSLTGL